MLRRKRVVATEALGDLVDLCVMDDKPDAATAASTQELHDLLADALISLPTRCRQIVLLRKIKGVPQKEVAAQFGLSERTVENHCRLGVKRCEEYLRARGVNSLYHDEP